MSESQRKQNAGKTLMGYLRRFVIFFGTTGRFCAFFFSPQGLCFAAAYKVIANKSCGEL